MKRHVVAAIVGLSLVSGAVFLAVTGASEPTLGTPAETILVVAVLAAVVTAVWKVKGALADPEADEPAVPWSPEEPFASPPPELAESEYPLSSAGLSRIIESAGECAREEGTVEAGIEAVRPSLRTALIEALVAGGRTEEEIEAALEAGNWTDDSVAASVLDASVDPPQRSLWKRIEAWLFPERVLRRRTRRAMDAIARVTEEALPTVPGQTAPRSVPVVRPRLETLQRGVDGRLQQAVDPTAVARGPLPPEPSLDEEGEER